VLREKAHTLQAVCFGNKDLIKYLASIPRESYIEAVGEYSASEAPIKSCSIENFEFHI
jgi:hypothetical protein